MTPTLSRRRFVASLSAAAVLATFPTDAAAMQPEPRLQDYIDVSLDLDSRVGAVFGGITGAYSYSWTEADRERFLDVIEREFPGVAAFAIRYLKEAEHAP